MGNFVFINSLLNFLLNWCDGLWALALPNHPCGNPWCRQWSPYHPASRYLSTARKWCWRPMWSCCGRWPLLRACKMKSNSKTPKTSRRNQSNLLSNNRFKNMNQIWCTPLSMYKSNDWETLLAGLLKEPVWNHTDANRLSRTRKKKQNCSLSLTVWTVRQ